MMLSTRKAITALLAVDDTATTEERDRVAIALAGSSAVLKIATVAERLGLSRPTVYGLIRRGVLRTNVDGMVSEVELNRYVLNTQQEVA